MTVMLNTCILLEIPLKFLHSVKNPALIKMIKPYDSVRFVFFFFLLWIFSPNFSIYNFSSALMLHKGLFRYVVWVRSAVCGKTLVQVWSNPAVDLAASLFVRRLTQVSGETHQKKWLLTKLYWKFLSFSPYSILQWRWELPCQKKALPAASD